MAAPEVNNVDLGFVEEVEKWKLLSHMFPSKVGGKPAWLSLKPLPEGDDLKCRKCQKPSVFLAQIYAPAPDDPATFHRTLFLFICKDPACCARNSHENIRVFRSQLARVNEFYSTIPPNDDKFSWEESFPSAWDYQDLCEVCGCHAPKKCAKCRGAAYCSREHQIIGWKSGHKTQCAAQKKPDQQARHASHAYNFPEMDLVTEPEEYEAPPEKSEEEKMEEYELAQQTQSNASEKELEQMARQEKLDDIILLNFKDRISHEPTQVLRYNKGGTALWVSSEGLPSDIPPCKCGAKRQFEFQILPQLLSHLDVDSLEASIDWGTIAVYTCTKNCDIGNSYTEEFAWKQDFSDEDIKPE